MHATVVVDTSLLCCVNNKQTMLFKKEGKVLTKVLLHETGLWSFFFTNLFKDNKLLHHEAAALQTLYFRLCVLNVNKIVIVACFCKMMSVLIGLFQSLNV